MKIREPERCDPDILKLAIGSWNDSDGFHNKYILYYDGNVNELDGNEADILLRENRWKLETYFTTEQFRNESISTLGGVMFFFEKPDKYRRILENDFMIQVCYFYF